MSAVVDTSSSVFLVAAVVGTIAFAASGVMAAAATGMDWLGAVVLGIVVAVGGGTIRDVLLGIAPVGWIDDEWPVWVAIATSVACLALLRLRPDLDVMRRWWFVIVDAIGLGAFVVLGTTITSETGASSFVIVLMGVVTGVGGGVIRDVVTGRTPIVFVGEIYAVAGVIGAVLYVGLDAADATPLLIVWLPIAVVVAVRAGAVRLDLHLPKAGRRV
jgi:uncharacterized membrane protein YeiH